MDLADPSSARVKTREVVLAGLVVLGVAALLVTRSATGATHNDAHGYDPVMKPVIDPKPDPLTIDVHVADDAGEPGQLHSVMVQRVLGQAPHTTGPSPDQLRVRFDAAVRIEGIRVSVDIAGPHLVEVVAGINTPVPYGMTDVGTHTHRQFEARDWLIHTSDSNGGAPSKIDERSWWGDDGYVLNPEEYVAIDAWLGNPNDEPTGISPEVIISYNWL